MVIWYLCRCTFRTTHWCAEMTTANHLLTNCQEVLRSTKFCCLSSPPIFDACNSEPAIPSLQFPASNSDTCKDYTTFSEAFMFCIQFHCIYLMIPTYILLPYLYIEVSIIELTQSCIEITPLHGYTFTECSNDTFHINITDLNLHSLTSFELRDF